jgi:hypothetical protein
MDDERLKADSFASTRAAGSFVAGSLDQKPTSPHPPISDVELLTPEAVGQSRATLAHFPMATRVGI